MPPTHVYGATFQYPKGDDYSSCIPIILAYFRSDMTKTIHDYKRTMEALLETDEAILRTEDCMQKRKGRINDPLIWTIGFQMSSI